MQDITPEIMNQRAAEAVRSLRERYGMSQGALAEEMKARNISWLQQTVGRVESGLQPLRLAELAALADVFGVRLERFTWAPAEARAADWLDMAAHRLRRAFDETAQAVVAQLSAADLARNAIRDTTQHQGPLVLKAREAAEEIIDACSEPEAALSEGKRAYNTRHPDSEGGDGDGGDAEGEPGLVDQRGA